MALESTLSVLKLLAPVTKTSWLMTVSVETQNTDQLRTSQNARIRHAGLPFHIVNINQYV